MTEDRIKTKYLDYEIIFSEYQDRWEAFPVGSTELEATSRSLKDLKSKLSSLARKKYPRVKVIIKQYAGQFEEAEVTSVALDSRYSTATEFWVIRGKKRTKERAHSLFAHTKENLGRIAEAEKLKKQSLEIYNKIAKLEAGMESFDWKNYKAEEESE